MREAAMTDRKAVDLRRAGSTGSPEGKEERVLLLYPYGRSAEVMGCLLVREGFFCEVLSDAAALAEAVREGAGAAILGSSVLAGGCEPLRAVLNAQPLWSDLPVVLLVPAGQQAGSSAVAAEVLGPRASVKVLQQPVRGFELVSLMRAALRGRRHQYELRDHMEREHALLTELEASREELRALNQTLEERIEARTAQVRALSRALTMAEQQERRRISQILHDDLQQMLYGIRMKISFLGKDAETTGQPDLLEDAQQADAWIGRAIETTRRLTVDLCPPILRSEGLREALVWLAAQMKELHGLEVEIEAKNAIVLEDEDLRVLLFQIVRELLFNAKKHAETDRAAVELERRDRRFAIRVMDEGRGFDVAAAAQRQAQGGGFGLFSVRERLDLFGGHMEIDSAPGEGTRVTLYTPPVPEASSAEGAAEREGENTEA